VNQSASDDDELISRPSQVTQQLLELIARDNLRPGDPVPSEVQFSRELQVSRNSVRESYRALAALGVIEIGTGRRPRLMAMSSDVVSQVFGYALTTAQVTVSHVMETRRGVEIQSAQLAALRATKAQKDELREHVAEMRAAIDDHQRRIVADLAMHRKLAEASRNPLNTLLLDALHDPLKQSMLLDLGEQRTEAELIRIVDAHEAIVDRVCVGDAVGAGAAMSCHFDMSSNIMLRIGSDQEVT